MLQLTCRVGRGTGLSMLSMTPHRVPLLADGTRSYVITDHCWKSEEPQQGGFFSRFLEGAIHICLSLMFRIV
jgi:hypothetical protein